MSRRTKKTWALLLAAMTAVTGCMPSQPVYLFNDGDLSHYKGMASDIEYPDVDTQHINDVEYAKEPLTLTNHGSRKIWDVTLQEAIKTALANSKVLRNLGGLLFTPGLPASNQTIAPTGVLIQTQGQNPSGQSLGTGQTSQTIYNPAIQETNPTNGVESALSQFDAYYDAQMWWQNNNIPQNQVFNGLTPAVLHQDYGQMNNEVAKFTSTGGQVFARNISTYNQNNSPANVFPSAWTEAIQAEFRHPLLQGAGVEFNRIAGPRSGLGLFPGSFAANGVGSPFVEPNAVPGNYNGVMLARINVDITLADFEAGVRNMVSDVERAYWDLYYNYRNLAAVQKGRDSALQTWRKVYALFLAGGKGGEAEKEAQSREQYFLFRAQVENSLGLLYTAESRLRYMMGLAPTDGRLIRPSEDPTTAEVKFDWNEILPEALTRSVELRRQRWVIKQNELKLVAARNFLMPRLDAQALYSWQGLGNDLLATSRGTNPLNNAFQSLTTGQFPSWQIGLNFTWTIGFRLAMSGVRNAELIVAQSKALLQDQELELTHTLTNAVRDLDRNYRVAVTTFNRRHAAARQVDAVEAAYNAGTATVDMLLDAQRRLADAEVAYFRALIDYNVAIMQIHYRKNSLLEYDGVYLAEGPWPAKAYFDARKRARERDSALFLDYGFTRPKVASRGTMPQYMDQPGQQYEKGMIPSTAPAPAQPKAEEIQPPEPNNAGASPLLDLSPPGRTEGAGDQPSSDNSSDAALSDEARNQSRPPVSSPGTIPRRSASSSGRSYTPAPSQARVIRVSGLEPADERIRPTGRVSTAKFQSPAPSSPSGWQGASQ